MFEIAAGFLGVTSILIIYFIPALAAKGKNRSEGIFALNFFLGWTFIGWVIALVWALSEQKRIKK